MAFTNTPPTPAVTVRGTPSGRLTSRGTAAEPIAEPAAVIDRALDSIANGRRGSVEGTSVVLEGSEIVVLPSGLTICPMVSVPVEETFTNPSEVAKEMPKRWLAFTDDVTVIVPRVGKRAS